MLEVNIKDYDDIVGVHSDLEGLHAVMLDCFRRNRTIYEDLNAVALSLTAYTPPGQDTGNTNIIMYGDEKVLANALINFMLKEEKIFDVLFAACMEVCKIKTKNQDT